MTDDIHIKCSIAKHARNHTALTFLGDWKQKLMITESREMQTMPNTTTLVLANMPAPIKHTIKLRTLRREQYKNRHHRPSGNPTLPSPIKYPAKIHRV
jgi:hypothetical protein